MNTWPVAQLADLAESVDYGLSASASTDASGPKFLRITDIQDGQVDWAGVPRCECNEQEARSRGLRAGDIVFARTGATTGKTYLIRSCPADSIFASYLIRVRLKPGVDPVFVSHFFQTRLYWAQIAKSARGLAQPGVNASSLKTLRIPLPPLSEQRRIAEILDKADDLRAKRRAALADFDTLAESVFLEMFGDPVGNSRGWVMRPFGEVCQVRLGKMLDKKKRTGTSLRPYLRNANVQWFRFDLASVYEMDFDARDRDVLRLRSGDLLICEGGEPGRAAIWRGEISECYFQKALHRARPHPQLARAEYLVWLLWFLSRRGGLGGITSATIAHLTGEKLNVLEIPVPPLRLQDQFSERLTSVAGVAGSCRAALESLDSLFASLQDRAFRSEL